MKVTFHFNSGEMKWIKGEGAKKFYEKVMDKGEVYKLQSFRLDDGKIWVVNLEHVEHFVFEEVPGQ